MTTCIIPIGSRGQYEVVVDQIDYAYLTQWKWSFKRSQWKFGAKIYARRCERRGSARVSIYMHGVILRERMGLDRPSDAHEGDHVDIDSLNNRRRNLRWVTKGEQNANRRVLTQAERNAYAVAEAACGEVPF